MSKQWGWWHLDVCVFLGIALFLLRSIWKLISIVVRISPTGLIICAVLLAASFGFTWLAVRRSRWRAVFILDKGVLVVRQMRLLRTTGHAWKVDDIGEVYLSLGNSFALSWQRGRGSSSYTGASTRTYRIRFVNKQKELLGDVLKGRDKDKLEWLVMKINQGIEAAK
jgi:hypothetical protein